MLKAGAVGCDLSILMVDSERPGSLGTGLSSASSSEPALAEGSDLGVSVGLPAICDASTGGFAAIDNLGLRLGAEPSFSCVEGFARGKLAFSVEAAAGGDDFEVVSWLVNGLEKEVGT